MSLPSRPPEWIKPYLRMTFAPGSLRMVKLRSATFSHTWCMGQVIDAEGHNPDLAGVELLLVLRELAQLRHAVRSPVAAIKNQQ